ncbi:hypothetical protein B0H15DRAFT_950486 [Mycena belliarum]|uniref:Uncharacterized protein n=1 Tax=Mycena belliarum TaxID=1033014 RepID=A0AAD6U6M2_9AGAR|nr:hypothetical protein B0H15DRAFT_950486 [Mycena belliae]
MSTNDQPNNQDRPRLTLGTPSNTGYPTFPFIFKFIYLVVVEYQLRGSRHFSFTLPPVPPSSMSPPQFQLLWLWNYIHIVPRQTEDAPRARLHLTNTESPLDPDNAL